MTWLEMKKKVLALIEELNPQSDLLTDDPDIAAKYDFVATQRMFELARVKKIADYVEMEVVAGDLVRFEDIQDESDFAVYQIACVRGVAHEMKAHNTIIKVLESGVAEIEYYRYPTRVTEKNKAKYTFELSEDALEIMPYGVAGDLLKSDVSAEYGNVYAAEYERLKQMLDYRYATPSITIEGGVDV